MAKFHINPASGNVSSCRATQGKCPFGGADEHYSSAEEARTAYEKLGEALEESGRVWPPAGLPKKLIVVASTADLMRHYNDENYGGGEGVCLGASAFVSQRLIEQEVPHKLVRGEYTDASGEAKAHWWVESNGWILDASRGQFEETSYKSGVVKAGHKQYSKSEEFEPGHRSLELVELELKRCFSNPAEATFYLEELHGIEAEAKSLFTEDTPSKRYE